MENEVVEKTTLEKRIAKPVVTFTKADLLRSKRYRLKRDILNAMLEDGKTYTIKDVDSIIKTFLSKEVK